MNKLRAFALAAAGFLLALAGWGALRYGPSAGLAPFVGVALLGLVIPLIPRALARLVFRIKRGWVRLQDRPSFSFERGSMFVSTTPVEDPSGTLAAIRDAVTADDRFDAAADDEFSEGTGLTVSHAGFHNSFVRVSDGRLVVTGASKRTHALADLVAETCSLTFERIRDSPFRSPRPIRGAPRAFLGLFLFVLLVTGVVGFAGAAYPGDAYNPAEKTVLVGLDARGDFAPGVTPTDTRLDKASFLVDALAEEAVEVRWAQNSTVAVLTHGRQSVAISEDVRELLAAERAAGLRGAEAARADRIEADLHAAERSVADAIDERAADERVRDERLLAVRDDLRAAANTSVRANRTVLRRDGEMNV